MKQVKVLFACICLALISCQNQQDHVHEEAPLPSEQHMAYTPHFEIYVDFPPLVLNKRNLITVHVTKLGESFKPLLEGKVRIKYSSKSKSLVADSEKPDHPGIFELEIFPEQETMGELWIEVETKEHKESVSFKEIQVFQNMALAMRTLQQTETGEEILYLKNQAWSIDFANASVERENFSEIFRSSGKILPAPGDETMLTAKSSGTVIFHSGKSIVGAAVNPGEKVFTVSSGDLTQGNPELLFKEARTRYEKAKADFERAQILVVEKVISEKDFLQVKADFEMAENNFRVLSKNHSSSGIQITSPIRGYVKQILVLEGQYVEPGTPLAQISQNRKLLLEARISQKYFHLLPSFDAANFRMAGDPAVYNTESLNGKIASYGKSTNASGAYVPLIFEIDNVGSLIPGSVVEIFLKSSTISNALTIPLEAIMEEMGNHYVFVQRNGETFYKREVKLGGNDGIKARVTEGLKEGERVVTKGAYAIKLASASGAIPEHGHSH